MESALELAAQFIGIKGTVNLLHELARERAQVNMLAEQLTQERERNDRLVAAIDSEREAYQQVLANRDAELTRVYAERRQLPNCKAA